MHQFMDNNSKVDTSAAKGDGLDTTSSAHAAAAPVARDDMDVCVFGCSRNKPTIFLYSFKKCVTLVILTIF